MIVPVSSAPNMSSSVKEVADDEVLKDIKTEAWSSLNQQDYLNKLTQIGRKIIAMEALGKDTSDLVIKIKKAVGEEGIEFIHVLVGALHHSQIDQRTADAWLPRMKNSGAQAASKMSENISEALKNADRLSKIVPEIGMYASQLRALEVPNTDVDNFEKLINALKQLERLKDQVKKIEKEIDEVAQKWIATIKIRYELEGGSKYSRLVELADFTPHLGMQDVDVPRPQCIKTSEIYKFLKRHIPEFDKMRQERKIDALREAIKKAFAENPFEFSLEVLKLIEEMKTDKAFLIVRSSGTEDSRQCANAGGNETVSYVNPDEASLKRALRDVVLSFLSAGSLQNQINSGLDPFMGPLKMDVVVQELIGEAIGGEKDSQKIPASIVMFTNEPMYVGNEPFRIMRISATWGHGEAVVGPMGVKSDTYLILKSLKHPDRLYILKDLQAKPTRLAPLDTPEGIKLSNLENPADLVEESTLNEEVLTKLFYYGLAIERVYGGHPLDMEFVIKEGKIRPLQARPVNRLPPKPTYLDGRKVPQEAVLGKAQGETCLPGRAEAIVIHSRKEVLIVEELSKAEEPGQEYTFKRELHKIVIVKKPITEKNSHPVVNFSSMGIPVLYCSDKDKLEEMLKEVSEKTPLVACTQSGSLVLFNSPPESFISEGYTVHPAKIAISSSNQQLLPVVKTYVPTEIKNLLMQIRALDTSLQASLAIKQTCLKEKREKLQARFSKGAPKRIRAILASIEALEKQFLVTFSEFKKVVKTTHEQRLHSLFHSKVVETLLTQDLHGLGQLSLVTVESELKAVEMMLDYQDRFLFPTLLSELVLEEANLMTHEQKDQWTRFLVGLEEGHQAGTIPTKEIEEFKKMIQTLKELDVLPLWFSSFFLPLQDLSKLKALFDPDTEQHLKNMHRLLQEIQTLQDSLEHFEDPLKFEKMFVQLLKLQKQVEVLTQSYEKISPLGKISTVKVLSAFVEVEDRAIKAMKKSQQYTDEHKVRQLDRMLLPYIELLEKWLKNLAGKYLKYHFYWPLETYLDKLKECLRQTTSHPSELIPSRFSAAAAILNLATAFDRSLPRTKEDVFTLVHQNLLVVIQVLLGLEMKDQTVLPSQVVQAIEAASSLPSQLVGYDFDPNQLVVHYNYPLRNHSAKYTIRYDKVTEETYLDVWFVGEARERWDNIRFTLDYFHRKGFLDLVSVGYNSLELRYSLKISDPQKAAFSFSEFQKHVEASLTPNAYSERFFNYVFKKMYEKNNDINDVIPAAVHFSNLNKFREMTTLALLDFIVQEEDLEKQRKVVLMSLEARICPSRFIRKLGEEFSFPILIKLLFQTAGRHEIVDKIRDLLASKNVEDHEKAVRILVQTYPYIMPENIDLVFHPKILAAVAQAEEPNTPHFVYEQTYWQQMLAHLFVDKQGVEFAVEALNDPETPQVIKQILNETLTNNSYFLNKTYAKEGIVGALAYVSKTLKGSKQAESFSKELSKMIMNETNSSQRFKYALQAAQIKGLEGRLKLDCPALLKDLLPEDLQELKNLIEALLNSNCYLLKDMLLAVHPSARIPLMEELKRLSQKDSWARQLYNFLNTL